MSNNHFGPEDYKAVLAEANRMQESLLANDPRFRRVVLLVHHDGSTLLYRSAFIERLGEWILVFAEHHPALAYHQDDLRYTQCLPGRRGLNIVGEALVKLFADLTYQLRKG